MVNSRLLKGQLSKQWVTLWRVTTWWTCWQAKTPQCLNNGLRELLARLWTLMSVFKYHSLQSLSRWYNMWHSQVHDPAEVDKSSGPISTPPPSSLDPEAPTDFLSTDHVVIVCRWPLLSPPPLACDAECSVKPNRRTVPLSLCTLPPQVSTLSSSLVCDSNWLGPRVSQFYAPPWQSQLQHDGALHFLWYQNDVTSEGKLGDMLTATWVAFPSPPSAASPVRWWEASVLPKVLPLALLQAPMKLMVCFEGFDLLQLAMALQTISAVVLPVLSPFILSLWAAWADPFPPKSIKGKLPSWRWSTKVQVQVQVHAFNGNGDVTRFFHAVHQTHPWLIKTTKYATTPFE